MDTAIGGGTAAPAPPAGTTATIKLRPPGAPAPLLPRPRLRAILDDVHRRRLTSVVAGAGFGKSTLLAAWATDVNCAWYTASSDDVSLATFARGVADALRLRVPALPVDAANAVKAGAGPGSGEDDAGRGRGFAAVICEILQSELRRDLVLVLDDVHEIAASAGAIHAIEALCRQAPERLHLVIASRDELPFPVERLRGQGQVMEITGSQLAFDVDETTTLLMELTGDADPAVAAELHRLTGGWPAAVRLAVEFLRGVPPADMPAALERMRRPGGPLLAYLAAEVFAGEDPRVAELVARVAPLDRFTAELCAALGIEGAVETLRSLARRGLLVELQGREPGWYALGAPVREFALAQLAPSAAETREVRIAAARWFESRHEPEEALRSLSSVEAHETARLLEAYGGTLLSQGAVDAVLDAAGRLPPELRTSGVEQLVGEAHQVRGDWDEALRCFERAAEREAPLPPALAWRMGLLLHLGGRLDEAVTIYDRADESGEPRDVALLLAWRASAHWLRGDADACRVHSARAFEIATRAGDPQALAAAHTVLGMLAALEGDRSGNEAHYLRALDYAQQAGDVLQLVRVRTNRGSRHVEECSYEEALSELDHALRLADLTGFAAFRALALSNRGEALSRLGRFDEAIADLEVSRALYQRLGSRMIAYPLEKLGEVYRIRGDAALARVTYEEALRHAEAAGDVQGLGPTLTGLARTVAADDADEAQRLAERALALGSGMNRAQAVLTAGWVALVRHDAARAADYAVEAASEAGRRRDRASLAESLELRALADPRAGGVGRAAEAETIWRELGNPTGQARAAMVGALLAGDDEAARCAEAALAEVGAKGYRATLALVHPLTGVPPVVVQSLGRFRVLLSGEPVPLGAWQSRKARDLLKILVARRGRPTPREALMEALWPGQSPGPLGNRLSVLLSTVRGVLDPGKRRDQDHFVGADKNAVWLDEANLSVDVEEFLRTADEALRLHRAGGSDAVGRLAAAEADYTGDFLEEDAYEDWALAMREEARATYIAIARALADTAAARGDVDATTRYSLRVLERDPYDEPAHLGLVAALERAGRHGEARRRFRAYCARMDEIGVESAPFPAPQSHPEL
jgi:ATP/maltotriose-dependent transcriptional regulator MalT/DNA-binding SARP family transcriptional activator